uniref:Putative secreted salivary protein n=1 Tax=Ixodes scapularis TaxID=6945 RepID=Q4PN31_IXOSC|nr:putative secreted salivary protein [Ixodes scapularis]
MLLVVLAVVLILPSFLSGESSSDITEVSDACGVYIREGGDHECSALGTEYKTFNLKTCTMLCKNGQLRKFPEGVCSSGNVSCTSEVETILKNWLSIIQKK